MISHRTEIPQRSIFLLILLNFLKYLYIGSYGAALLNSIKFLKKVS